MKYERLIINMTDQVKEAQLKLGYARETVRLYYPLSSLNAILGTEIRDGHEMLAVLKGAFAEKCVLGQLSFALHGGRVEVSIPPEGVAYVHEKVEEPAFLAALIALFQSNHHCSLKEIQEVFERFEKDYICESVAPDMGFDFVLYFRDKSIDSYYYCVKEEMGHTIYHRFAEEDYQILVGESTIPQV